MLIQALIISHLNYSNILVSGSHKCNLAPRILIVNASAKIIFLSHRFAHVTLLLLPSSGFPFSNPSNINYLLLLPRPFVTYPHLTYHL